MDLADFKHGAPSYGKISRLFRQHKGTGILDKRFRICTICHVDDTVFPILLPRDKDAAHSTLSRRCLFQFFLLDYKLLQE